MKIGQASTTGCPGGPGGGPGGPGAGPGGPGGPGKKTYRTSLLNPKGGLTRTFDALLQRSFETPASIAY